MTVWAREGDLRGGMSASLRAQTNRLQGSQEKRCPSVSVASQSFMKRPWLAQGKGVSIYPGLACFPRAQPGTDEQMASLSLKQEIC